MPNVLELYERVSKRVAQKVLKRAFLWRYGNVMLVFESTKFSDGISFQLIFLDRLYSFHHQVMNKIMLYFDYTKNNSRL